MKQIVKAFLLIGLCCALGFIGVPLAVNLMTSQKVEIGKNEQQNFVQMKRIDNSKRSQSNLTFADRVKNFPFEELLNSPNARANWIHLFNIAFETNIMEPLVAINHKCKPQNLTMVPNCNRARLFTGSLYRQPIKIGHGIQFGFDVDVLEIHLNEIYDVVDKIFLIESTMFHNGGFGNPKPLSWEIIKRQERFSEFQDKIVHLILDDLDTERIKYHPRFKSDQFAPEKYQEFMRWEKILEWNNITGFFQGNDMIGLGDTDEIASRDNINRLKRCQLVPNFSAVDIGIWFPRGNFDMAFASDFPVRNNRWTLGDPTFRTFKTAMSFPLEYDTLEAPSRARGASEASLIGGIHMSHYDSLSFQLMKGLSCTECLIGSRELTEIALQLKNASEANTWAELEYELHMRDTKHSAARIIPLVDLPESVRSEIEFYPWFYVCNKDRYSLFSGKTDTRTS